MPILGDPLPGYTLNDLGPNTTYTYTAANGNVIGNGNYPNGNYINYTNNAVTTVTWEPPITKAEFEKLEKELEIVKEYLGLTKQEPPPKHEVKPSKRVLYDYPGDGGRWEDL